MPPFARLAGGAALMVLACLASGWLLGAFGHGAPLWPMAGVAVGVLLLLGRVAWPVVVLVTAPFGYALSGSLPDALLTAVATAAGPALAAQLLAPGGHYRMPTTPKGLLRAAGLGVLVPAALSAAIGAASGALTGAGPAEPLLRSWWDWFLADTVGIATIAPAVVTVFGDPSDVRSEGSRLEALGVVVAAAVLGVLVVGLDLGVAALLLLPLVWTGLRFRTRGASIGVLLLSAGLVVTTALGRGPLVRTTVEEARERLALFLVVVAVTGVTVGVVSEDRRRTLDAIAKDRERLRALFDQSPLAVVVTDLEGRLLEANPAAAELYGVDAAGVARLLTARPSVFDDGFVAPEARAELAARLERLRRGEPVRGIVTERQRPDGSRIAVRISAAPIRGEDGVPAAMLAMVEDITAQRELGRARDRLVAILENTPDYVAISAATGERLFLNAAGRRLLGLAPDAPVGHLEIGSAHVGWSREKLLREALPTAAREGAWVGETCLRAADGREVPMLQLVLAERDATGQVLTYATVARDISDLKRAESVLARQAELMETMLDNLPVMVTFIAPDGTLRYLNRAGVRLTGWRAEELLDPATWERVYPDAAERERVQRLMRDAEPGWHLVRPVTRDGRQLITRWANVRLSDGSIVGIGEDITEREAREAERRQTEERLREVQKYEAIGLLAGGVAHDFNNLLTTVVALSEVVRDELPEGDPARDDLLEIRRAGERAAQLTQHLLAFSRRQMIQPRPLDLNAVVRGLEPLLVRMLGVGITCAIEAAPDLAPVLADPAQLEQVLVNLIINARDAMDGTGTVRVETAMVTVEAGQVSGVPEVTPGRFVRLRVRDTGSGMDEATRQRIFEPFFTTKPPGKGTGLGLSTVYGIVRQNGGFVEVDSAPGAGTEFRLYFPATGGTPAA